MGLSSFLFIYPEGKLSAIDAYFFGVSASTVTGLTTVDVPVLKTYQQLFLYFVPLVCNIVTINIIVVVVRLIWFRRYLKNAAPALLSRRRPVDLDPKEDPENAADNPLSEVLDKRPGLARSVTERVHKNVAEQDALPPIEARSRTDPAPDHPHQRPVDILSPTIKEEKVKEGDQHETRITFDPSTDHHPRHEQQESTLYIPGPRARDQGTPTIHSFSQDVIEPISRTQSTPVGTLRRRRSAGLSLAQVRSVERVATVASSLFVIGNPAQAPKERPLARAPTLAVGDFPRLSREVTIGRNSIFHNLSSKDREELGGIEYKSLKLLLKIIIGYYVFLHCLGAVCLIAWVQHAPNKYVEYIDKCGQNRIWWAVYSAQTMITNLGFTLTPDSMISFNDAPAPLLIMSALALAGHTFYPVLLRLVIWATSKAVSKQSSLQEPLHFLLNHPRRCYTLLFPSGPTWALFGILALLNLVDVLFIILLDLDNSTVTVLPGWQRFCAAVFQAVSSRHTGTASFNLANVNPAVQMALLIMMYISVYPISIVVRSSNTYEERSLGIYEHSLQYDEEDGGSYFVTHLRNQLSFDLWYICLGLLCISIAEHKKIMDGNDPAFTMWPMLFEGVSAYCNVGLSLGYPTINSSFCTEFTTFSKLIICAMMIRGRHRGLPYALDRAIVLPTEKSLGAETITQPHESHESHEHRE
ncbi:Low-affinity potassium transport protein [Fusarium oxysporum f. sp. cubense race 1]|uniref:Low-affinity potassium transport protein n=1 Tax=Fusarium oxysporum f. sp. cubense (strain race 1) TaxID=1229664 RepID=N4UY02_FUSC1|nr:Low-affinity potassium transport protein [Fusarium oxysporum f. sp. cubense race 1]